MFRFIYFICESTENAIERNLFIFFYCCFCCIRITLNPIYNPNPKP